MGFYDIGLRFNPNHQTGILSESDWFEINSVAGWKGRDLDQSVQVVMAESSGDSGAVSNNNPAGPDHRNIGGFQIWAGNVRCPDCLKDPVYCANVARRMWLADGGTFAKHWETAAKGNLPPLRHAGGPGSEAQGLITPIGPSDTTLTNPINSVVGFLQKLTSGALWLNIGKVALGGVLFILGILAFANELSPKMKNLVPPIPIPV